MGEFIQWRNSTTFTQDDVYIGGVSYKQKYPGYRFRSESSDCNILEEIDGEGVIVEVYSESYIVEDEDYEEYFQRDIVAVLKNQDAYLYSKLQWLDTMRSHPAIRLGNIAMLMCLGTVLLVVQYIAGFFIIETGEGLNSFLRTAGLSLVYSVLLVAAELALLVFGSRALKNIFGFFSVLTHILRGKEKLSYYKKLFEKLSKAHCRDKAKAAKFMSKVLFFC